MSASLDINALFQAAESPGALSAASLQALTIADIGAMIQTGLGTSVDDVTAFQVFSQSAVRASQSATHFGQAVLGGLEGALPSSLWR